MATTTFKINGQPYTVNLTNFPPDITLKTFIREHAQLTATKYMCLEGGCGACIVTIKGIHPASGEARTWAANSCLTLLNTCVDWEIITTEGVGNRTIGYHPIQKRMAHYNASQCGFCTPGFVMNMYGLFQARDGQLTMAEVENSFGGNLCRCTGYRPILDAMKSFAVDSHTAVPVECMDIEDFGMEDEHICPRTRQRCMGSCHRKPLSALVYDSGVQWHWPKTLEELFAALSQLGNSEYMLVAGNTAHGVYRRSPHIKHFIDVNAIAELKRATIESNQLTLGGNLSLSEAMELMLQAAAEQPGFEYCEAVWRHFDLIANVPVRNMGTLAGNISIKKAHHDFPSDVYICFEALDAEVVIQEDIQHQKSMSLLDYINTPTPKQVIVAFVLKPYPKDDYTFNSYKIMPRAQNAHAYVNAGFLINFNPTREVKSARICFGGINPTFTHATAVEYMLVGQNPYSEEVMQHAFAELQKELHPDEVLTEASPEYRKKLACGLFYKFLLHTAPPDLVKEEYKSGGEILQRPLSSGSQTFQSIKKNYPLTQPVEKLEAKIQCTGEATYMDDMLTTDNSVHCAFVPATRVGASIEQIDASEALQMSGVIAFFSAKDIPGLNSFVDPTLGYEIEELFCSEVVKYYDQPLGLVVAATSDEANRAASKVKVVYASAPTTVLSTMADVFAARAMERILLMAPSPLKEIKLSDKSDVSASGIFEIGGQYHFTMEPHTTIAVPFERGLQIWSATQWMDHTQAAIAKLLQMKVNEVQLKVRRLGGGYGAKITRGNQVACAAALCAFKLNRPARFVQTIESMMVSCGKRWACRSDYEFHVKANGKIVGLKNDYYEDAGCTINENPVPAHSILTAKNCYEFTADNYQLKGHAVLTDAPSSAWCRAPGSVEGIAMIENIIEHIAFETNNDPADVRRVNINPNNKMAALLPRFTESTEYKKRHEEIEYFNEKNRWRKRGLGLCVMEYPLFYHGQFAVTVTIYRRDGTVVISHGGIEMGQGINTKVAQVAAYTLGIPLDYIKVEYSDTINGANSDVTGAAVTSESVCFAVRKACTTLNERLKPIKDSLSSKASWEDIILRAYQKMVNLIASDEYKVGDLELYSVFGLALTELEVDLLTGNHLIRRTDLLEDAGESLSPYVDIGQVEGSFVMCLGYWLTEQLKYNQQTGQLVTNRTWTYKPPGAKDIPIDFRIELLQNSPNPAGFLRSKATGEPPCCLAVSVIFAMQQVIQAARKDAGVKREWIRLGAPTTPETVVLNIGTDVQQFTLQ